MTGAMGVGGKHHRGHVQALCEISVLWPCAAVNHGPEATPARRRPVVWLRRPNRLSIMAVSGTVHPKVAVSRLEETLKPSSKRAVSIGRRPRPSPRRTSRTTRRSTRNRLPILKPFERDGEGVGLVFALVHRSGMELPLGQMVRGSHVISHTIASTDTSKPGAE